MKISRHETTLLVGMVAIVAGFGLYGAWANRQAAISKVRIGTRAGTYRATLSTLTQGKRVKVFHTFELKPDGQYTKRAYFGYKWPSRLRHSSPTFAVHPDGGFSFQIQKGTYKLRDDEVDLMRYDFVSSDGGSQVLCVTTARFTGDGFTLFKESFSGRSIDLSRTRPRTFVKIK